MEMSLSFAMPKGQIFTTSLQSSLEWSTELQIHPYLPYSSWASSSLLFPLEPNILITFHVFVAVGDRLKGGHHDPQHAWYLHLHVILPYECPLPTNRMWQRGTDITLWLCYVIYASILLADFILESHSLFIVYFKEARYHEPCVPKEMNSAKNLMELGSTPCPGGGPLMRTLLWSIPWPQPCEMLGENSAKMCPNPWPTHLWDNKCVLF